MRYLKKPKTKTPKSGPTILFDDREHNPWTFISDYWPMERKRLKVGDYTIKGFENRFTLEKKSGLLEILTDLSAPNRKRFERFLEKPSAYPIKCMVVEDPLTNALIYSTLTTLRKKSRGKSRLIASTIYHWTAVITTKYNIPLLFMDKSVVKQTIPIILKMAYQKALSCT